LGASGPATPGEYAYLEIDNASGDNDIIEVFNIVSTGDNARGNFVKFDGYGTDGATELNITGTTNLRINFNDGYESPLATIDASNLIADLWLRGIATTVDQTIIGAQGNNDIALCTDTVYDAARTVTTFDGNDTIMAGSAEGEVTINTGGGNDEVHTGNVDLAATLAIDLGAGDDIIFMDDTLNAGDSIDGGDGFDTIALDIALVESSAIADGFADTFENFEALRLCGIYSDYTVDMADLDGIQYVIMAYGSNANTTTLEGLSDGATLEYARSDAGDVIVNLDSTTGDQTFNVFVNGEGDGADDASNTDIDQDFGVLTLNGVETLNLSTATRCKDFDVTDADGTDDGVDISYIGYALDLDMDALEVLNITGNVSIDLSGMYLENVTAINADTFTGGLQAYLGSANENDVTITTGDSGDAYNDIRGGSGNDTITITSDADNDAAGGALGNDTITITGDGDNWITGGYGGNDVITVIGDGANDIQGGDAEDDGLGGYLNNDDVFMITGNGDNSIEAGNYGNDTITITGDGDNYIQAGDLDDTITITGNGDNTIYAGKDDDTIVITGSGANWISGGDGLDTMTGGSGVDTYDFCAVTNSQGVTVDVITNFEGGVGGDILDFASIVFVGVAEYIGTAVGYGAVLTSLTAGSSNAVLDSTTSILYVDVDASGTLDDADMAIQLTGVTGLTDADNFVWA